MKPHPTKSELTHHSSTSPSLGTSVFDCGRTGVPPERVQLELGLVPNLGRQGLVSGNVEVCAADDFVGVDAFASFHVTEDTDPFYHRIGGLDWGSACG
jgi:hypothetical protein